MKKIISLLLIVAVMSTFVACKNNEAKGDDAKAGTEQVSGENKSGDKAAEGTQGKDASTEVEAEPEVVHVETEKDLPEELAPTEEVSEEDGSLSVKESLLGVWKAKSGDQQLEFFEGMVTLSVGEMGADGQYAIDMEKSVIYVELLLKDGMIQNTFPFKVEDGNLKLFKPDGGEEFVKQ